MSLWKIAWRSIQQRGLASWLTTISMALGVMLVVVVLSIMGIVSHSLRSNAGTGYNIIVGAKGGSLQLTLNTVYYLSKPIENIPYDYYLEFLSPKKRRHEWQNSIAYRSHEFQWKSSQLQSLAALDSGVGGGSSLASALALEAMADADSRQQSMGRRGKFGSYTGLAVPVCLGDYFGRFRVVGTTPQLFDELKYGSEADTEYKFSQGRNFQENSQEHSYFEAVVGFVVADEMNVKIGDEISPAHGDPEGEGHAQKFTVVGILAPTGTPHDRAVFINMEGFFLMEDHAKPIEKEEKKPGEAEPDDEGALIVVDEHDEDHGVRQKLPVEQREVTAILVRTSDPVFALGMPNTINEAEVAQAVFPREEIGGLLDNIVGPIQLVLFVLTVMICLVSGIGILISIYNSMTARRREIAVMRALGAGRGTVMAIILLESIFLSLGGGVLGWLGGHTLNVLASGSVERFTGVSIGFFDLARPVAVPIDIPGLYTGEMVIPSLELFLIPGLILLAIVVGFLPALSAYRTDVAKSLSS